MLDINILMLAALWVLSASKVTVQSFFGKKNIRTAPDSIAFNGLVFGFISLLFGAFLFKGCAWPTVIFGALFGIGSVCFQFVYTRALSTGPVSLTVMLGNLAMVVPTFFSVIVYHDACGPLKIVGLLLTIIALVLNVKKHGDQKAEKGWLFYVAIAFLMNALVAVDMKIFSTTYHNGENFPFVAVAYITAALVSAVIFLFMRRGEAKLSFSAKGPVWLYTFFVALFLGSFQALNSYASGRINGVFYYPALNGGSTMLLTLSGVLLFKEKLSARSWASIAVGVAAIILLSL